MKNFIKGMLTLWTILTTLWSIVSVLMLCGFIRRLNEFTDELSTPPGKARVTYGSYYNRN